MKEIQAPHSYDEPGNLRPWLFLAGSIEMGAAEEWQRRIVKKLSKEKGTILNPRRDDWDSSWVQSIDNHQFYQQVSWELQALEDADIIALYLSPGTKSPISLLELGLHMDPDKTFVCCPQDFWRKGNVDITCQMYDVAVYEDFDEWLGRLLIEVSLKA